MVLRRLEMPWSGHVGRLRAGHGSWSERGHSSSEACGRLLLQRWFSNTNEHQNLLEGFFSGNCWALPPEFLIQ